VIDPSAATAAVSAAPARSSWELALLLGCVRALWELVELMAASMLPLDMLAFAASLFGRRAVGRDDGGDAGAGGARQEDASGSSDEEEGRGARDGGGSGGGGQLQVEREGGVTTITVTASGVAPGAIAAAGSGGFVRLSQRGGATADDAGASVLQQVLPHGPWEWRAAAAVAAVRFVLMPAVGAAIVLGAAAAGLLGPAPDAGVLMALMLQGVMPPAQALVVMMQLRRQGGAGGASELAGVTARLTLQLYAAAVVPITLWASCFAAWARSAAAGSGAL
jgi:hypothetical protein